MGARVTGPMAKWGQGDDRWIVEERKDGANVNGWHWSATSVFDEARGLLESMLEDEGVNPAIGDGCRITKVDKFTGEVHTNARKGKIRLTYDLVINFEWTANPDAEEEAVDDHYQGAVKFSEVIDHEPEASVTIKTGKDRPNQSAVVRTIKSEGVERCVALISA